MVRQWCECGWFYQMNKNNSWRNRCTDLYWCLRLMLTSPFHCGRWHIVQLKYTIHTTYTPHPYIFFMMVFLSIFCGFSFNSTCAFTRSFIQHSPVRTQSIDGWIDKCIHIRWSDGVHIDITNNTHICERFAHIRNQYEIHCTHIFTNKINVYVRQTRDRER